MNLVCPECNLTESRRFIALRLETCTRCAREGRSTYLVEEPALQAVPQTETHPGTRRAS